MGPKADPTEVRRSCPPAMRAVRQRDRLLVIDKVAEWSSRVVQPQCGRLAGARACVVSPAAPSAMRATITRTAYICHCDDAKTSNRGMLAKCRIRRTAQTASINALECQFARQAHDIISRG